MLTQTLDFTKDFPKAYRYSVGEQMQNIAMRMVNEVTSSMIFRRISIRSKRSSVLRRSGGGS